MSAANRGKYTEGKVRDWLKQYKGDRTTFTFNRVLDAYASKGAMSNPQTGDFQWFMDTGWTASIRRPAQPGEVMVAESMKKMGMPPKETWVNEPKPFTRNGVIEVKETQNAHRLEYNSFSADQAGRMRIRELAGSEVLVLICHRPVKGESAGKTYWRSAPLSFFLERPGTQYGSWDLSNLDAYTHCDDILKEYLR